MLASDKYKVSKNKGEKVKQKWGKNEKIGFTSINFLSLKGPFSVLLSSHGQWEKTRTSLGSGKKELLPLHHHLSTRRLTNKSTEDRQLLLNDKELISYSCTSN